MSLIKDIFVGSPRTGTSSPKKDAAAAQKAAAEARRGRTARAAGGNTIAGQLRSSATTLKKRLGE